MPPTDRRHGWRRDLRPGHKVVVKVDPRLSMPGEILRVTPGGTMDVEIRWPDEPPTVIRFRPDGTEQKNRHLHHKHGCEFRLERRAKEDR